MSGPRALHSLRHKPQSTPLKFEGPSTARAKFNERIRREKQEALDTAIREVKGTGDLLGLMNANRKQMDAYDSLARSQAAFSYRTSQIAMGVGLALVMSGVIIVILSE
jgi:hypothetical protein